MSVAITIHVSVSFSPTGFARCPSVQWQLSIERTLELLLNGAVSNAVSLEDEPWTVIQVAVTRLFWEVGGVPCVRIRQKQIHSNQDEDEDQDWSTVCHYKNRRLFFTISRFGVFWTRET